MRLACHHGLERRLRILHVSTLAFVLAVACSNPAWALITGGEGNEPLRDPGWPEGAAVVFNNPSRVAWWEGPPFGGGEWHAECKGDAAALNLVLADYAKMDVPKRRIVLHDGFGNSFWLNPNREKGKKDKALIDWSFSVWQPKSLKAQRRLPVELRPVGKREEQLLAQVDVYTGGFVRWADVIVPQGIEVVDRRLEARGFKESDGTVVEGKVIDLETKQPLSARMIVERIDPQQQAGYRYTKLAEIAASVDGKWVLKNAPTGWCRIALICDGYVSRVIGYGQFDEEPQWLELNAGLSKAGAVTGRVVDDQGKPLAEVDVRFDGIVANNSDDRYEVYQGANTTTDSDGRFRIDALPLGSATVWIRKSGYVRPGLGAKIEVPTADLNLEMKAAAKLQVRVNFSTQIRPAAYLVEITPEGGNKVGSWGGSGQINADGQITFDDVPPGRYQLSGKPNPSREGQETDPVTVDLKGGATQEVTLKAR